MSKKTECTRITVNLPTTLVEQIDKYADAMNINRTSAVAVLLSTAFGNMNAIDAMSEMLDVLKQLSNGENNNL